jgi:arylsulfatase A-like enzyme
MPAALFSGIFATALLLGLIEALSTGLGPAAGLPASERALAGLFAAAPFVLIGLATGGLVSALAALWIRARRRTTGDSRVDDLVAGLAALSLFGSTLGLTALLLRRAALTPDAAALALTLVTPLALLPALIAWLWVRALLQRADRLTGRVPVLGALLLLASVIGVIAATIQVASNDAIAQRLGRWPPIFLTAWPLLSVALTLVVARMGKSKTIVRVALLSGLLSAWALSGLIHDFDTRPGVKRALLDHSLVFRRALDVARPLFDLDGDGYAGLLGGGDCDDHNPAIHPGAPEQPRNGIDDDCFGGDSPGRRPHRKKAQIPTRETTDLKLVERPDLVLITVDTLRADHVGYHGYARPITPNLDALARRGLHFMWAFAQGPQTKASVPSVFTGRYASEVRRSHHRWARTKRENHLVAEYLRDGGYATAGIPAHNFFKYMYGMHQGFEQWDLSIVEELDRKVAFRKTGGMVVDRALAWLDQRATRDDPQPFFLWLHLFDPHFAYKDHDDLDLGERKIDHYDEEIAYTDRQLGRLMARLEQPPFAGRTYVLLHSDHGEAFGEHGYRYHGQHLYNDQIHVPLTVTGPGLPGRAVGTPVSGVDLLPTLLDLAGLPIPGSLQGTSLVPFAGDDPPEHGPVFSEMLADANHSDRRVIVQWPWKLQWGITFGEYTLYDLSKDPNETEDLSRERPAVVRRLYAQLRRWMAEDLDVYTPTKD